MISTTLLKCLVLAALFTFFLLGCGQEKPPVLGTSARKAEHIEEFTDHDMLELPGISPQTYLSKKTIKLEAKQRLHFSVSGMGHPVIFAREINVVLFEDGSEIPGAEYPLEDPVFLEKELLGYALVSKSEVLESARKANVISEHLFQGEPEMRLRLRFSDYVGTSRSYLIIIDTPLED